MLSILMLYDQNLEPNSNKINESVKSVMAINTQDEVIKFCKHNHVDIVLMETDFIKESQCNNLIKLLRKECENTKLVYITDKNDTIFNKFVVSKIDSTLNKNISYSELIGSLSFIKSDYRIFPNAKIMKMNNYDKLHELTPRELEVLDLICQAKTRSVISEELSISENTLKTHIQNILNKTNYNSISKLALDLVVKGELDVEE